MKKLFIFDLDGTLVDAYGAISSSLNFTRKQLGYSQISYKTVKESVGKGDRIFINMFFAKKDQEKALRIYRCHHRQSLQKKVKALPMSRRVLFNLKRRGKKISIASNRPTLYTNIILERLDFRKYIDFILCADKIKRIKPDPAILLKTLRYFKVKREEAVFIGDMIIDVKTAKTAGVDGLFVKGGSTKVRELKKQYPQVPVLASLEDILKMYE